MNRGEGYGDGIVWLADEVQQLLYSNLVDRLVLADEYGPPGRLCAVDWIRHKGSIGELRQSFESRCREGFAVRFYRAGWRYDRIEICEARCGVIDSARICAELGEGFAVLVVVRSGGVIRISRYRSKGIKAGNVRDIIIIVYRFVS